MPPSSPKRYHQRCFVARALDLVGERWTLLIVRDLLLGGRRYSDLLAGLPGLTTNLLAARLARLSEAGLVERRPLPPPGAATVYELTPLGRQLEPVVLSLGAFGEQHFVARGEPMDPHDRGDARWSVLSLKRRYRGSARAWRATVWIDERAFAVRVGDDVPHVHDGEDTASDLVLRTGFASWAAWLYRGASARTLSREGALERDGPARAQADFARAFGLRP